METETVIIGRRRLDRRRRRRRLAASDLDFRCGYGTDRLLVVGAMPSQRPLVVRPMDVMVRRLQRTKRFRAMTLLVIGQSRPQPYRRTAATSIFINEYVVLGDGVPQLTDARDPLAKFK